MDATVEQIYNLHLIVLERLLHGEPFTEIEEDLRKVMEETNYLEVARNGLLSFNEAGELIAAYPVSPSRTNHMVEIEGLGVGYSMCAVDALGIAYTFMRRTTIHSQDHKTGEEIKITIDPHSEIMDHELYVTYIWSDNPNCDPATDQCPSLNFYTSIDHIDNPEQYTILTFKEALDHSISVFAEEGIQGCIQGALTCTNNSALTDILVDLFED